MYSHRIKQTHTHTYIYIYYNIYYKYLNNSIHIPSILRCPWYLTLGPLATFHPILQIQPVKLGESLGGTPKPAATKTSKRPRESSIGFPHGHVSPMDVHCMMNCNCLHHGNRVISTAFKQARRDIDMMLTTAQWQYHVYLYWCLTQWLWETCYRLPRQK